MSEYEYQKREYDALEERKRTLRNEKNLEEMRKKHKYGKYKEDRGITKVKVKGASPK